MIHFRLFSVPLYFFVMSIMYLITCAAHGKPDNPDKIEMPTFGDSLEILNEANENEFEKAIAETGDLPIEALSEELGSWFQSLGFPTYLTINEVMKKLEGMSGRPLTSENTLQDVMRAAMSNPELLPISLTIQAHDNDAHSASSREEKEVSRRQHVASGYLPFSFTAGTLTPLMSFMVFLKQLVPSYATNPANYPAFVDSAYVKFVKYMEAYCSACDVKLYNVKTRKCRTQTFYDTGGEPMSFSCETCKKYWYKQECANRPTLSTTMETVTTTASTTLKEVVTTASTTLKDAATTASTALKNAANGTSELATNMTSTLFPPAVNKDDGTWNSYIIMIVTAVVVVATVVVAYYICKKRLRSRHLPDRKSSIIEIKHGGEGWEKIPEWM